MERSQSARSNTIWTRYLVPAAAVVLLGTGLASCFGLDQWVASGLMQSPIHWDANIWVLAFTRLGKGWLQVWLLLVWLVTGHQRRDVLIGLIALALAGVSVTATKVMVARPRPYEALTVQPAHPRTHDVSFPSGDTATAVAVTAAILPAVGGPMRYLLPAGCAGIGWFRIAGNAHYPSDVLAGAAIGLLSGWLARRLAKRQSWLTRELPLERWLVLGGIVGLPIVVMLSKGFGEKMLFLKTYGTLTIAFLSARCLGNTLKTTPERVLSFLKRWRLPVLAGTFIVLIGQDILTGAKPRELLPLDGRPGNPLAVLSLLLVAAGVILRLRARILHDPPGLAPQLPPAESQPFMTFGLLLVVCGLLCQLLDWVNWLVVLPLFVLFYGVPWLGGNLRLSQLWDPNWWSLLRDAWLTTRHDRPPLFHLPRSSRWTPHFCTRDLCVSLVLLLLPLTIELLVEDFVFESLLHQ